MKDIITGVMVIVVLVAVTLLASDCMKKEETVYQKVCDEMVCKPNELRRYCEAFNLDPEEIAMFEDTWDAYEKWNREREANEEAMKRADTHTELDTAQPL